MSYILDLCKWCFVVAALVAPSGLAASAGNVPLVSGSYRVVQKTDLGSQTQIRMRIHLVNHGTSGLSIERMTLWDFSHPEKGGSQACAVTLPARASADTTQEFTIRLTEYEQWQKGLRPRLVLQTPGPGKTKSTTAVRLDRIASKEAK